MPLDNPDEEHHDGNNQENMNEIAKNIEAQKPNEPQNYENGSDCCKHKIRLMNTYFNKRSSSFDMLYPCYYYITILLNIKTILNRIYRGLQILPRRRSEFPQPTPRGFACSQNIAAVVHKLKNLPQGRYFNVCGPYRDRTGRLAHAMRALYQMS